MERFVRALDGFEAVLRGFPDNGWEARSPCDPWTARDVAGHMIGGLGWARAIVSEGSAPGGTRVVSDSELMHPVMVGPFRADRRTYHES